MGIDTLVMIYIYICVCILVFNLAYLVYKKQDIRALDKNTGDLTSLVRKQLEQLGRGTPPDEHTQRKLYRRLCSLRQLIALDAALTALASENNLPINEYLKESQLLLNRLAIAYSKKANEKKAYFAYFLSRWYSPTGSSKKSVCDIMISFISSPSAYVRENALKTLYSLGDAEYIIRALRVINLTTSHQNAKLLADGLMTFGGNHSELMRMLWQNFRHLSPVIQVSIVTCARTISEDYKEPFYALLSDDSIDREVRLAVLRYFRKHTYPPMQELLSQIVLQDDDELWEFSAVAATVLQSYPCEETLQALYSALPSQNWYVRFNAADSLIHMGVTPKDYMATNKEDKYAREMMEYRWQMHTLALPREALVGG